MLAPTALLVVALAAATRDAASEPWIFACAPENDLCRVALQSGLEVQRFDDPARAVVEAAPGSAVLVLADGYPSRAVDLAPELFRAAARKELRLYVEYPARLPGVRTGEPRRAHLERAVVASEAFAPALEKLDLLAIHDCHFIPVETASAPHLVLAKVAGFDAAVYGLDGVKAEPLLFELERGAVLVSTTKLSQFVTARYAPKRALQALWRWIFAWLRPGASVSLEWTPIVRPTYGRDEALPPDAARRAIARGIDWHSNARMLIGPSWKHLYARYREDGTVAPSDPVGPRPSPDLPPGDGEHGILEGVSSRIRYDGEQPVRWWLRSDSNGESSLAFALRSKLDGDERSARIAANLLDFVYVTSGLFQVDPARADFGLIHWAPDATSLFGDNDVKAILGCMGTAAALGADRWDAHLLRNILGNFRTTGAYGFRGAALSDEDLLRRGWEEFWRSRTIHYAPHYEAWIWATYIWLYDKVRWGPLLERTRDAIRAMMDAYPDEWRWTNGIQQERGRMLLPLAWLVRVEDLPEYRGWLERLARDMRRCQDASGAIREELGDLRLGTIPPPRSNADYGRYEASIIQRNGDPVADLLYTSNFSFLGLHEAAAATGDPLYREMEDRLAEFLVRVQVRSEARPELDGGWFRAFDFEEWEYWGSNADAGWGAWSIEVGWTQGWVPAVLALRELGLDLWGLTARTGIARFWEETRALMLTEAFERPPPLRAAHAAAGKPVELARQPDPRYPARGAASLADGKLGGEDFTSPRWLGYFGEDFEATVDLGEARSIRTAGANFLQSTGVGIYLPRRVEILASEDGKEYRHLRALPPPLEPSAEGPAARAIVAGGLAERARYVRVRAANLGTIPDPHPARGLPAWLFVDEVLVEVEPAAGEPPRGRDSPSRKEIFEENSPSIEENSHDPSPGGGPFRCRNCP